MSRRRDSFHLEVPGETNLRPTAADRRRFSVCLVREDGHRLSNRATRRAQADPYPQANPARMSKNHSPPPRPRSASDVPDPSSTGASSNHPETLPINRKPHPGTTNRRVRFTPEVNKDLVDPKDNMRSNDPAVSKFPSRKLPVTRVSQSGGRSPSPVPETGREHTTDTTFSIAPIRRSSPEERVAAVEEISSDESEDSNDRALEPVQTHAPPRKDNSIRSGIEELLEANKEVPMVDVGTADALVSLLSRMDRDSGNRSRSNPRLANPAVQIRTGASDVQREVAHIPTRTVRKFHSSTGEGETVWWESRSGSNLTSPLHDIVCTVGDLYIHRNATDSSVQIWICHGSGSWEKVAIEYDNKYQPDRVINGLSHPSFPDRRLKLRKNGEPSWIMKQTCATIKSRRKGAQ